MEWTTALPDWDQRIEEGRTLIPCNPLFIDEATESLEVFKQLKIVDAPGSPTIGEACDEWVFDFAKAIFGAYDTEAGRRLIQEFFLLIPKKNSKSTIAAGIMMTLLIRNWRQSAELIILAPTIEVAQNAYAPARDMIKYDEDLSALFNVQDHTRTITHRGNGATLKVVAADSNTVGGKKASFILIDEIHLFGKVAQAENMLREATGGLASRPEGCIIYLTTQSDHPPAGIFKQKLDYARDVRDGKVKDNRFMPVLYEFPKAMIDAGKHLLPENFHMVNPNIGISVDRDYLEREYNKASLAGGDSLLGFLSKFLNVEIGLNLRNDRWAGADFWQQCAGDVTLESLIERSEVVVVGIDGGGLDDLLGFCAAGREVETGKWLYYFHAWAHEIVLNRRKDVSEQLNDFKKDGKLTIVKQPGDDVIELCQMVGMIRDAELLPETNAIGVDAAGIGSIVEELTGEDFGLSMDCIVAIGQGWKLNGAIKTLERKLASEGAIEHDGSAMMNWCVGNAKVVPVGNAIRIDKQVSGSAKIDPVMAGLNATQLLMLNPTSRKKKFQMFFI